MCWVAGLRGVIPCGALSRRSPAGLYPSNSLGTEAGSPACADVAVVGGCSAECCSCLGSLLHDDPPSGVGDLRFNLPPSPELPSPKTGGWWPSCSICWSCTDTCWRGGTDSPAPNGSTPASSGHGTALFGAPVAFRSS